MLDAQIQLHREFFLSRTPGQRLFVALHLQPLEAARLSRPALSVAFVVDTSQSMRERVMPPTSFSDALFGSGKNKLDLVVEALEGLLASDLLRPEDRLSITQFDDGAKVVLPFTSAAEQGKLRGAIRNLPNFSGGTSMGKGMQKARPLLAQEQGNRRMVLLTDGQTTDERLVQRETNELADLEIPVTTVGVGDDVNTDLLTKVADLTQGQPMDVVPDSQHPQPPAVRASDLPAALLGDLQSAANEVITNVTLGLRTIQGVTTERITRVQPTQTEVDLTRTPSPLGNLDAHTGSTFVLEFSVPDRTPSRVRIGQLTVGYQVPGSTDRAELPPLDIVIEFTADDSLAARIHPDVMRWVQQRNIEGLVVQATQEQNPQVAHEKLLLARQLTERLKNDTMTRVLDRAIDELQAGKTISVSTAKTLRIGAKTQTLKAEDRNLPTDEDIRRITGA
ncbi:VWA domain-containing protein [Deinococcus antarcticus]|uniref:VWA domain-containing protein n=1 Tax=Deinococcus antarcticus TaxID=1298767 RepID=A0ABV8A8K9_9DEIO